MPIRPPVPRCALRSPTKLRRPRAGRTARRGLAALAGCAAFAVTAGPASAAELLTNGGFESGTFSGWTTTQLTSPYTPWVIATSSDTGGMSLATPQEGTYDAMNGFDGNGPGHFTLSQTVSIPTGSTVLSWRACWRSRSSTRTPKASWPRSTPSRPATTRVSTPAGSRTPSICPASAGRP